ncbi:hypothetical protein FJZ31_22990 [Candidatus Poribacteria bacterium]|nr:hypothetical protein [Candidatus Poribacteria bacterium]
MPLETKLKAGVAVANITPPVGVDMTGFGGRPSGAIGIHDDIFAKVLVLDDGNQQLAIVTSDLLSLDFDLVKRIRDLIEANIGIPPENVMLSSSHTHSGPATIILRGLGKRDEDYVDVLVKKIAGATQEAYNRRMDAKLGFGRTQVQIGVNRRQRLGDGNTVLGVNPDGPVAPYVDVVRVDNAEGKPIAIFFSHAAHPVVLGGSNVLISADYPGYAMRLVAQVEVGSVAMFGQGCCGNINSNPVGGTFEDARRLGTILGAAVIGAAEQIKTISDIVLQSRSRIIALPLQEPLEVSEAEALVERYQKELSDLKARGEGRPRTYMAQGILEWAQDMLKLVKEPKPYPPLTPPKEGTQAFEIQAMQLGDVAIVALTGEVFVELALEIDARSPSRQTIVLGYTNGCIGYVPNEEAYPYGGYEVSSAYRYYGTLMLKPETDRQIRNAAVELLTNMMRET